MRLENVNVERHDVLISPEHLKAKLPIPEEIREFVTQARHQVEDIVSRQDSRVLVVVGPCSIHDPEAAIEYATRLGELASELKDRLYLVMRVYFEKPRSTVGWKGLINDPYLDDSFKVDEGLHIARELLLTISAKGLPIATEALDPITPQYLQDLIAWSAIGARTTESQTHREMASGLSCPVGFKNGTDGSLSVAINGLQAATTPHSFLGINPSGQVSLIRTRGNPHAHIVLRGGSQGPNYNAESVAAAEEALVAVGAKATVMVDCSHANSSKDHNRQTIVLAEIGRQIGDGNSAISGVMVESNLNAGSQALGQNLAYGVSVTDACVGWEQTEQMLRDFYAAIAGRFVS